jgi:chemotaxis protein methyltransferase WspC
MKESQAIASLLERRLGLAHGSVGEQTISSAIQQRMAVRKITSVPSYSTCVMSDEAELTCLIESVVVHETSFFRYPDSFRHFATWASERKTKLGFPRALRVLSIPSSTGEEPYSLAMTLLGAGIPPEGMKILGVDISRNAVATARTAVYGDFSFRDVPDTIRSQYFTKTPKGFHVNANVRQPVTFQVANILEPSFLTIEQPFDAIFCRNLFIYLTEDARKIALGNLDRLLAPDGLLYAGHAESFRTPDGKFTPFGPPHAFAFVRTTAAPPALTTTPLPVGTKNEPFTFSSPAFVSAIPSLPKLATTPAPVAEPLVKQSDLLLRKAHDCADAGKFAEAEQHCQTYLLSHAPSAEVYSILGVIRHGQGKSDDAERNFQQALYLNPKHYDSLVHMVALSEQRRDAVAAANYKRRAAAALKEEGKP